ncbi:hypothetical protein P376_1045 [Streptomyces sp. HCCB10043]|uniref:Predicted protein n=1 Tax=Streptomyces filamentosus NRRL 15998 TaxID=457431 RepID=D6AC23_STRFL|nr:predicted protein [Streptomyces filamentosus NRRL 15998]ESU50978.1 hypothetical protein P376_1045 [Streptomyces sp. HCCB10043]EWS91575.1 hypothetical protein SSIG_02012 [Streptomyces filamentosus NRRL 11379]
MNRLPRRPRTPPPPAPFAERVRIETDPAYRARYTPGWMPRSPSGDVGARPKWMR